MPDEIDDFERKKTLVVNEKYFEKCQYLKKILWKKNLAKTSQNIFAYSFVSESSKHLFSFWETCIFSGGGGVSTHPPHSLADASAKSASFFLNAP